MISSRDHEELLHHVLKTMVQEHLRFKSLTDPQYRLRAARQTDDVEMPAEELDLDIDEFEIKVRFVSFMRVYVLHADTNELIHAGARAKHPRRVAVLQEPAVHQERVPYGRARGRARPSLPGDCQAFVNQEITWPPSSAMGDLCHASSSLIYLFYIN